ncbi:hypothetical protein N9N66_04155 [Schleiferiaceae bacterium]|nr:hypothetical protein [Schleiferiaceae bacterium]
MAGNNVYSSYPVGYAPYTKFMLNVDAAIIEQGDKILIAKRASG